MFLVVLPVYFLKILIKERKKNKRYTSINVEENETFDDNMNDLDIIYVKNKKFNNSKNIPDNILYDNHKFKLDNHHNKNHPKIINYRCINYRKNERNRNT